MSAENGTNRKRRHLILATAATGGAGIIALATPLLSSLSPSERAKAAAEPIEIEIGGIKPGELLTLPWRGRPVWIFNRTEEMLARLPLARDRLADPDSEKSIQPTNCKNQTRSITPNLLVVMGVCTHFGCSPVQRFQSGKLEGMSDEWHGGFLCQCHGAAFDLSGRVYKNTLAPTNLEVPPHRYLSATRIIVGDEEKT